MKSTILIALMFTSSFIFGQSSMKMFGDLQGGAAITTQGVGLYHGTAGFNVIFENNLYLRAGGTFALGGRLTTPNSEVGYTNYGLRVGLNNTISESFRIVPYLGLGYQSVLATTRQPESTIDDINNVTSTVGVEIETRYEAESYKSICAPIGVDFHFHNDKIGFVAGYYFLLSEYAETGIRIGLTFGKQ